MMITLDKLLVIVVTSGFSESELIYFTLKKMCRMI